ALASYETLGNLGAVEDALKAWQDSKGAGDAWKNSARNRTGAVTALVSILAGVGDNDAALGVDPAMVPGLVDARRGVLYLFSHLEETNFSKIEVIMEGGLGLLGGALSFAGEPLKGMDASKAAGIMSDNYGTATVLLGDALNVAPGVAPETAEGRTLFQRLKAWLEQFVKDMKSKLFDRFGIVDTTISAFHNLAGMVASALAKAAEKIVPLSGIMTLAQGVGKTADQAKKNFDTWRAGREVELGPGMPSHVANAIVAAMKASLFDGLWTAIKGATSIGMAFATAGASAIVDMAVAAVEMIGKLIWRAAEASRINQFIRDAGSYWRNKEGMEFASQPFSFNSWFRNGSRFTPLIPMLTLNTGICGDKMRFLQMFEASGGGVISQSKFDAGVKYIDKHLKPFASDYLNNCPYDMNGTPQVNALIDLAKTWDYPDDHPALRAVKAFFGVSSWAGRKQTAAEKDREEWDRTNRAAMGGAAGAARSGGRF
ncbi:MAG: hypothetical protein KJP18_14305, partial [Gemmatimonadetes bacterium]|nr:hypothetical protein [Gemmatimonadota bacterium]